MTAHIVATAIRDNDTGRIWSAVGDLGLPEPRPERLENSPKVRFASGFLTDAGQFLTSQEGYGTVLAPRPFPGDGELYPEHSK
jgi:hypothetical protein